MKYTGICYVVYRNMLCSIQEYVMKYTGICYTGIVYKNML